MHCRITRRLFFHWTESWSGSKLTTLLQLLEALPLSLRTFYRVLLVATCSKTASIVELKQIFIMRAALSGTWNRLCWQPSPLLDLLCALLTSFCHSFQAICLGLLNGTKSNCSWPCSLDWLLVQRNLYVLITLWQDKRAAETVWQHLSANSQRQGSRAPSAEPADGFEEPESSRC